MSGSEAWYVIKCSDGHCEILPAVELQNNKQETFGSIEKTERWGPFATEAEAIARRVGLIRAGKCQPA